MPADGSVEIRITGTVDPSVATAANAAKASIASLSGAKTADAAASTAEAAAVTRDTAAQVANTAATQANTAAHVSSRASYEGLVLVHEALSGRFSRMGSSAMIMAQAMGAAVNAEALLAIGAGAAVLGLGYLMYEQAQAEEQARGLAEAFTLTGQTAQASVDGILGEIDALSQVPGVSHDAAVSLVEFNAAHPAIRASLADMVDQLVGPFTQAFGDKAPEAINKLKEALSEIERSSIKDAIDKFRELNETTLNLDPAEAKVIENMILLGNTTEATERILQDLGQRSGVAIQGMSDKVKDVQAQLQEAQNYLEALKGNSEAAFAMGPPEGYAEAVAEASGEVDRLRGKLQLLQGAVAQDPEKRAQYSAGRAGADLGDTGHFRPHRGGGGGGRSHEDPDKKQVQDWAKELEQADIKAKDDAHDANADMLVSDINFWQTKLAHVTKYSQLWYDIQAKLQPLLARQTDEQVRDVLRGEEEMARARTRALEEQKRDSAAAVQDILDGLHREEQAHRQFIEKWRQDQAKIARDWHGVIDPVISATGNQIKGLIEGTETWGQALRNIGESVLSDLIQAGERWVEQQLVAYAMSSTAQKGAAEVQVTASAGEAAAATFAAWSPMAMIDPALPAEMGAAAFGQAMALGSFDKGVNVVPADMIAQVHAGERIVPAADNRALINAVAGGGGRSGHTINNHFSPTIHAHQPPSLKQMLQNEGGDMLAFMRAAARDGALRLA